MSIIPDYIVHTGGGHGVRVTLFSAPLEGAPLSDGRGKGFADGDVGLAELAGEEGGAGKPVKLGMSRLVSSLSDEERRRFEAVSYYYVSVSSVAK